jgi:hypothetical protein
MARLQILQLPEGVDDSRPPFALVVDQSAPQRWVLGSGNAPVRDVWHEVAAEIGARGVIVTAETVEIPANEVSLPEPAELVAEAELRYECDEMRRSYEGACGTIADMHAAATGREGMGPVRGVVEDVEDVRKRAEDVERKLSESEALGHRLLQRAELAEAVTAQTKALLDRRTRTLRERAEQAEAKLQAFVEAQQRELVDRMDEITDALGLDRLRDWGEIVAAAKRQRDGGHEFGVPGYLDPERCAQCGLDRGTWLFGTDPRTCAEVRVMKGGE